MNARGFKVNAWLCIFIVAVMLLIFGCGKEDGIIIKPFETSGECEPAFSSDGGYIAYTKEGQYEIRLFKISTEESEYLTDGSLPDWSPDGKEIVYVRDRDIYKINVETREIKQLTTWGSCFFPDWHPNGFKIAYRDSDGVRITDSNFASTKFIARGDQPDWSPTGDKIVYIGSAMVTFTEIFIMDSSGQNSIRLTDNQVGDYRPAWSPDGSKIAYVSATHIENEIPDYFVYNVWLMDTNGMNKTQLTFESEGEHSGGVEPAWSPDGDQIVYAKGESFEEKYVIKIVYHLWIMDADGENKRQLTGKVIETFGCK